MDTANLIYQHLICDISSGWKVFLTEFSENLWSNIEYFHGADSELSQTLDRQTLDTTKSRQTITKDNKSRVYIKGSKNWYARKVIAYGGIFILSRMPL